MYYRLIFTRIINLKRTYPNITTVFTRLSAALDSVLHMRAKYCKQNPKNLKSAAALNQVSMV